jgi:hypothetical protein
MIRGERWLTLGLEFRRLRYCRECGRTDWSMGRAELWLRWPASHFPLQMYGLREESLWQIMFLR